eukprot:2085418-Prymnesium_polylepis.1
MKVPDTATCGCEAAMDATEGPSETPHECCSDSPSAKAACPARIVESGPTLTGRTSPSVTTVMSALATKRDTVTMSVRRSVRTASPPLAICCFTCEDSLH